MLTSLIIPFLGIIVGIAAIPGVWLFLEARAYLLGQEYWIELVGTGISLGLACVVWGVTLVLLSGLLGGLFRPRLEPGRHLFVHLLQFQWAWSKVESCSQSSDAILAHAGSFFCWYNLLPHGQE